MAHPRTDRGLDRLVNFSDATVAIAITLLILPLVDIAGESSGRDLGGLLADNIGAVVSFAITFAVIGRFWSVHHTVFEYAVSYNRRLVNANLVWLASIVFLPFAANVISRSSGERANSALYIGTMVVTSGSAAVIDWLLTHEPGLGDPATIGRLRVTPAVISTALFALALVVAVVFPVVNLYALLLLLLGRPIGALVSNRKKASE
ncbi:putative membrane protein [Frondihabitans sp. PhB188]|uniref:TMEM175 family protein n=1 Tax=Frondihabitans sp. PhB188 TaxID=2485200 RepID=UPI000F47E5BE|nr:TMEM175 family protein [Frondihabitans sp. PhB188]ROQ41485.1 putative membrane protein [Frondihabitans sp. PhB188]